MDNPPDPGGGESLSLREASSEKEAVVEEAKSGGGGVYPGPDGKPVEIKDVWASTLDAEMAVIRELVERYPYVAMDTEFPGVVAKPIGDAYSTGYQYQTLQCNVDLLKIIQLGVSLCDGAGRTPEEGCFCWQFNFRFDLTEDMYAEDSIQLLKESGIDFARHADEGVDVRRFGELAMMSGLVLREDVRWISFHSGYDFGYLIKILTCQTLPADEQGFFDLLHIYFPVLYDVKLLMSSVDGLHGGLQRVAEDLKVERIGPMHQAGSDSLLTNATFFRLAQVAFNGVENIEDKYRGEIYGIGAHAHYRGNKQHVDHSGVAKYAQPPSLGVGGGSTGGGGLGGQTNSNNNNNNNPMSNGGAAPQQQQQQQQQNGQHANNGGEMMIHGGGLLATTAGPNIANIAKYGLSQETDLGSTGSQDNPI